jgi:hypothetical protein
MFSAIDDGLSWNALDFASPRGLSDPLVGLTVFDRKIFLFGTHSLEIWYNDGETPFSRIDGGFYEVGCIAPYSICKTRNGVYWLDHDRNVVFSNGGAPEVVSNAYNEDIKKFTDPSSCRIFYIEEGAVSFLVLSFESDGRTLVYNLTDKDWSEWASFESGMFNIWLGRSHAWSPTWNVNMIGSRRNGQVFRLTADSYTDGNDNIRFLKRTGFINYGNDMLKRNEKLVLKVKRGFGNITQTEPRLMLRWRDDGNSEWSNIMEVCLGKVGNTTHVVEVYPRGTYRTRQWEISCTDNVPLGFLDAEEQYSVLRP